MFPRQLVSEQRLFKRTINRLLTSSLLRNAKTRKGAEKEREETKPENKVLGPGTIF